MQQYTKRFLLLFLCFMAVVFVPWRVETIIPAEITIASNSPTAELKCCTSVVEGMEIAGGQDAIFFPESDQLNPIYIDLRPPHFADGVTLVSGDAETGNITDQLTGHFKGFLTIKGDRESLFMHTYTLIFGKK
jgi:hypothetical protein